MFMWTGYFDLNNYNGRKKRPKRTTRSVPQLGRDKFQVVAPLDRSQRNAVSFQLRRKPGFYLRCGERLCFIEAMKKDRDYETDASFIPLVGLWFPDFVVFESVTMAAHYLRLKNGQLVLQRYDGTRGFKEEASFKYSSETNDGIDMSYLMRTNFNSQSSDSENQFRDSIDGLISPTMSEQHHSLNVDYSCHCCDSSSQFSSRATSSDESFYCHECTETN